MSHSRVLWGAKRLGLVALVLAALLVAGAPPASAATLQVCPSGCPFTTIAGALAAAANGDTIGIAAGTYAGGFTVDKNVTLRGEGADQTTISGGGPVVTIANVSATIESVTIAGGTSPVLGGGISNFGTLTLQESTVSGNTARFGGGGIFNFSTLTLKESTVSGNTADSGGGIFNSGGTVALQESTVSRNTAIGSFGFFGGGIFNEFGTVTLQESTVSGNTPDDCVGC